MRILVTGANGFIGRATVKEALRRGHAVRALLKPTSRVEQIAWEGRPEVEIVRGDLMSRLGLEESLGGVDAVIHLAANISGDSRLVIASMVDGTEYVLEAMAQAAVRRVVVASSIAVYDYLAGPAFGELDEQTPLESRPENRDAYCRGKLRQEEVVRRLAGPLGLDWLILRPGVVYGPGRYWTPRLGPRLGSRLWLLAGTGAPLPLTFVENCAEAFVLGAERSEVSGVALNVVDDETPTQLEYARRVRRRFKPAPRLVPVPFPLFHATTTVARAAMALRFGGRPQQGWCSPSQLAARCRPRRYSNARLKEALGWRPRVSFDSALGTEGAAA